jgi:uncharacterized protein YecA (UPF0149 family)
MTEHDTAKTGTPAQQEDHVHGQDHAHVHGPWCAHGHDHGHHHHGAQAPLVRAAPKIGRNDPCPCGSGKKHKKCCLA